MPDLSFCNEMLADEGMSLDAQCKVLSELGYMGTELALGSLVERPHTLSDAQVHEIRSTIEGHGLKVTGLHWLLAPYPEVSISEVATRGEARGILLRLVEICAMLGGRVLVHGSPGQRQPPEGMSSEQAEAGLAEFFAPIAKAAEDAGVTYCLEPLSRAETSVINTVEAACRVVDAVNSPAFRTMIDTSAAGQAEEMAVPDLLRKWLSDDRVSHIQVNDSNRGGPGMGNDPFPEIMQAIRAANWPHPVAVEPFKAVIDATTTAALAVGTLRASWGSE